LLLTIGSLRTEVFGSITQTKAKFEWSSPPENQASWNFRLSAVKCSGKKVLEQMFWKTGSGKSVLDTHRRKCFEKVLDIQCARNKLAKPQEVKVLYPARCSAPPGHRVMGRSR